MRITKKIIAMVLSTTMVMSMATSLVVNAVAPADGTTFTISSVGIAAKGEATLKVTATADIVSTAVAIKLADIGGKLEYVKDSGKAHSAMSGAVVNGLKPLYSWASAFDTTFPAGSTLFEFKVKVKDGETFADADTGNVEFRPTGAINIDGKDLTAKMKIVNGTVKLAKDPTLVGAAAKADLKIGGTYDAHATATNFPTAPTIAYVSSATDVATVDAAGMVTGVKAGTATITATAGTLTATTAITVVATPATDYKVEKDTAAVNTGKTVDVKVLPGVANQTLPTDLAAVSADEKVATATIKDGVVTIKGVKAGTVKVTVSSATVAGTAAMNKVITVTVKKPADPDTDPAGPGVTPGTTTITTPMGVVTITVTVDSKISAGTIVTVNIVSTQAGMDGIAKALKDVGAKFKGVNVGLLTGTTASDLTGPVTVAMPIPGDFTKTDKLAVYLIGTDGKAVKQTSKVVGKTVEFTADSSLTYVLVEEGSKDAAKNDIPQTGDTNVLVSLAAIVLLGGAAVIIRKRVR